MMCTLIQSLSSHYQNKGHCLSQGLLSSLLVNCSFVQTKQKYQILINGVHSVLVDHVRNKYNTQFNARKTSTKILFSPGVFHIFPCLCQYQRRHLPSLFAIQETFVFTIVLFVKLKFEVPRRGHVALFQFSLKCVQLVQKFLLVPLYLQLNKIVLN